MSEAKHTPGRFRINWDRGAYYVSIPNYGGGEVVSAEVADDLLSIARRWSAIDGGSWHADRYAAERKQLLADTKAAIAKAEGRS